MKPRKSRSKVYGISLTCVKCGKLFANVMPFDTDYPMYYGNELKPNFHLAIIGSCCSRALTLDGTIVGVVS